MKEEELLEQSLKMRNPILFLGAGFSIGAYKGKKELPVGKVLRENIFEKFYKNVKLEDLDITEDDYNEIEEYNLEELCENINMEGEKRKEELTNYLVSVFKDAQPGKQDPFHKLLTEYNWKRIYTLNIDDLVENIYEAAGKTLCVQNEEMRKRYTENATQLIKIHGCVRKPELGFIFGKSEYQDSIQQENFKLRSFAQDFFDSDIIFVGTEFNEEDISYFVDKYKKSGSKSNGRRCFFVSPSIKIKLKNIIKANQDFYYIPWTNKKFLEKCANIREKIDQLVEKESILKENYFQKIEECAVQKKYYTSELYYGSYSTWTDFVEEWDVLLPEGQKCIEWINMGANDKIISVVGGSYVGKTVFARRLLYNLYNAGYEAYEYNFKGAMELQLFIEYVQFLPEKSKVALLVEDAAMLYKCLVEFMKNKPVNIERLVFVLISKSYYHEMKRHEMTGMNFREVFIEPQMNYIIANNVYDKLAEKRRLGELNQYGSNPSEKIKFIKSKLSVIDVLYTLTHGRGFEEFFSNCFEKLNAEERHKNFFYEMCLLYIMGFENYPRELRISLGKNFDIKGFLKTFEDIVIEDENENLKIRCAEVFEGIVGKRLSSREKKDILLKYFGMFCGLFAEGEENNWNVFFEKLLKLESLKNFAKLEESDIEKIFTSLEKQYSGISYYWMQRGLFEQRKKQFENANTFLNNAQHIQENSYQIRHALAKNEMEWAVYELSNKYFGSATYHYERGEKGFLDLIKSSKYTKALGYSVQSYTNLKIDYFRLSESVISDKEIRELHGYLIQTAMVDYSSAIKQAVNKVYQYCMEKGISQDITDEFKTENFVQYKGMFRQMESLHCLGDYFF